MSGKVIGQTKAPATQKAVNTSDSLKQAVTNLKSSFNTLFGGKKDTITITVSDVDYDDTNLTHLKESLKTCKGVKPLHMQYRSGNAIIEVSYKGTPTNLWDNVPAGIKKPFKLLEANDNNILLKYRNMQ